MKTSGATSEAEIDRARLFVPAAAGFYETFAPCAFTIVRVALGLILIPHGYAKLFGNDAVPTSRNFVHFSWAYPLAWAYFIGAVEFFGGILLALGLFTHRGAGDLSPRRRTLVARSAHRPRVLRTQALAAHRHSGCARGPFA
jgi:hypothetical protein